MATITDLPHPVTDADDLGIVMSDGCRLSARVWMPAGAGQAPVPVPVPAILEYIPYRKRDGTLPRDELMHPYFAGHGYACLRVDMRGNGDSDGLMADEYTAQELADATEVIAWIAAQPWCSGAVGMMGKSWGGFNCLQTAALRPPALRAVLTVCSTTDRFADDIHFKGGCLLGENLGWGAVMLSYSSRPPDPALRPDWRTAWLARLEAMPFLAPRWARHQARDAYWQHGSVCEDYAAIAVPVLSVGGWADNYMNTVSHLVRNLSVPVKGIVGPWVHQYPHTAVPGPRIGFLQEALRWWDRWLKGIDNGAENDPAYRAYMLDSAPPDASVPHRPGHWLAEEQWPTPRGSALRLHLTDTGLRDHPAPLTRAVNTPQHLGLRAGEFFPMGLHAEMPGDQRGDDALSVCLDTGPLDEPLALLGAAELALTLRADHPRGQLVARLCDVAPDGSSVRICHGMLNLSHRDDPAHPSPMPVGSAVKVRLTLDQMGYRLAAGHRLRLALSTTYWPFIWPSATATTLTLEQGELLLPTHPGAPADEWRFAPVEHAATWKHRVLEPGAHARRIETDLLTETTRLVIEEDSGLTENLAHGLATRETMRECFAIRPDDPLSARSEFRWTQTLSRGDWRVSTEARAEMWADATHLHMRARVTAHEGDREVFARDYQERVERNHL
jgi:putative CocE/NonD family hydrolase